MLPALLAALLGAAVGSLLNVVAHRLPRGESVVFPRSRCSACGAPVRPRDNVPVLSWLLLRGRCRDCRATISARYPLVEALTAALFVLVVLAGDGPAEIALGLVLVTLLVPVTLIDLEHRIIPNRLLAPAALAALALLALADPGRLPEHLIAAAVASGFLLAAALAYPGGMGMGDVKLAGVLGLFLGVACAPAMLVALLSGTLAGVILVARHGPAARKRAVPFGPFLALGGVVGITAGPELVELYLTRTLA